MGVFAVATRAISSARVPFPVNTPEKLSPELPGRTDRPACLSSRRRTCPRAARTRAGCARWSGARQLPSGVAWRLYRRRAAAPGVCTRTARPATAFQRSYTDAASRASSRVFLNAQIQASRTAGLRLRTQATEATSLVSCLRFGSSRALLLDDPDATSASRRLRSRAWQLEGDGNASTSERLAPDINRPLARSTS